MAIYKTATNMTVKIKNEYKLYAKKSITKVAEAVKIVAADGNIELFSEKKIKANGNCRS
jgi:hypothetical protein